MLRSLVGSEMCIRDSVCVCQRASACDHSQTAVQTQSTLLKNGLDQTPVRKCCAQFRVTERAVNTAGREANFSKRRFAPVCVLFLVERAHASSLRTSASPAPAPQQTIIPVLATQTGSLIGSMTGTMLVHSWHSSRSSCVTYPCICISCLLYTSPSPRDS